MIFALLAQLVEHFHGKEGVSGSSPEEGSSPEAPQSRAFFDFRAGSKRPAAIDLGLVGRIWAASGPYGARGFH